MLNELSIKSFAIIDDLSVSFKDGLTVMSGETGAGKSIIINAVNLILGTRASSKLIRTGAETAEIEAFFSIRKKSSIEKLLKENDYDPSEGLLIRRIISRNDRHKIYINGRIATIQILSDITENLASISGQHAHQGLLKEEQHLLLLDQFGNLMPLRGKATKKFTEILPLIKQLNKSKAAQQNQADQIELLEFQQTEISDAEILPQEDVALETERVRLKNSEMLSKVTRECQHTLYTMDNSISENLSDLKKKLDKAAGVDSKLSKSSDEMSDIIFRIEDLSGLLRDYEETIETDNSLLETTEERIDFLNKLKRKYGGSSGTLDGVLKYYNQISSDLSKLNNLSTNIQELEEALKRNYNELVDLVANLSAKRKVMADKFSKKVEKELKHLEMPNTLFQVSLSTTIAETTQERWLTTNGNTITETGIDKAVFMISPNIGEEMKPLAKIASGGELSRIILALKAILAEIDSVATIVFDEVDAGIGGGIAEVVGKKIQSLSKFHQVICITHLPQIAKFSDNHYKIVKAVHNGRTSTSITPLSDNEKITELARMLGGVEITDATLEHAREMIENT